MSTLRDLIFKASDVRAYETLFPLASALCRAITWLGCNKMAAFDRRFFFRLILSKAFLNASSGLIFASWQAFYAFIVDRFYDDLMESLFVAFSQLIPTHKSGCRDSFSILACMTDSRFLVAGAMPSMIEKH